MEFKHDQIQLNSVLCYLLPLGKLSAASWDKLRECKNHTDQAWRGGYLTKCREYPDFQTKVRQQVTQMLCDTGTAHKILAKKNYGNVLQKNLIIVLLIHARKRGRDYIKN